MSTHRFGFEPMVKVIPPGVAGNVKIEHFTVEQVPIRAMFHRSEYITPGDYVRMRVDGGVMMSDVWNEQMTNLDVIHEARGNVLIAGLGIGMVLVPILKNPKVESVTVVEKNPHVIAFVAPHIMRHVGEAGSKLVIVESDIHTWHDPAANDIPKGYKFDIIYFDIWAEQSTDVLTSMTELHKKYRRYLKRGGWMDSWNRDTLKDRKRQGY